MCAYWRCTVIATLQLSSSDSQKTRGESIMLKLWTRHVIHRYAHAEARKSPVVDGKVNRTADGKEVRFPVLLSPQEKEIARMVCLAFGQRVCGFDLLRSEKGRSYVCDVNGWSFVKNSKKYYDDTAGIVRRCVVLVRVMLPAPFRAVGWSGWQS